MTDKRYFFAIHYVPAKADCGLLAGRCISTLHGYLLNHAVTQIGVAFPSWSDKSIGRTIAFVLSLDQILIPCAIRSLAARKPSSLLCRASQPSQRAPQLAIPVRLLSIKPPSLAIAM